MCLFSSPEHGDNYDKRADGNRRIGDIERRPVVASQINIQKINNLSKTNPVDQIAGGAGENKREGNDKRVIVDHADLQVINNQQNRPDGDGDKEYRAENRRGAGQKPERGAGISYRGDVKKSVYHGIR